jgi:chromosome segregation ATPase
MGGEVMPAADVTREDLKRVEDRVEFVTQEVDGERLLSRYILKQARQNGDDLAAVKTRVDRIEEKVDRLEQKVDRLETDMRGLRSDLNGLRSEFNSSQERLPGMIADVMREVLRETKR